MLPLSVMVTPIPHSSNTILHPAFHSATIGISEYDDIPGMMWLDRAVFGNSGRLSSRVWVEVSLESSGDMTVIRVLATGIPIADAPVTRK